MRFRDGFVLALLALLGNDATIALAQYVATVTVSVNDNPFCTSVGNIGASGGNSGGTVGSGTSGSTASGSNGGKAAASGLSGSAVAGSGSGSVSGSQNNSAANGGVSLKPIDSATGRYDALGYYAAPADGNLLGGPVFSSPVMTVELCGTSCQGYRFLALMNGNECNCGSSAPSSASYSTPPSQKYKRVASGGCIPCAGNSAECCGAPGGYALVYHKETNFEGSSVVAYTSTDSAGSVFAASSTAYSPISSPPTVAYTLTSSEGSVTVGFSTSHGAAASTASISIVPTTTGTSTGPGSSSSSSGISLSTGSGIGLGPRSSGSGTGLSPGFNGYNYTSFSLSTGSGYTSSNAVVSSTTITGGSVSTQASSTAIAAESSNTDTRAGSGGPSVTSSGGGGAEPTVNSPAPSCASSSNYAGNNTKYNDYFGYTYDIRCNLDVQSMSTDSDAHAETFDACLEYCSLLKDCVAVNYQDSPSHSNTLSNCHPKWGFDGYTASTTDGTYSAVNVNGASPGTIQDSNLCTADNQQGESYNGMSYNDDYTNIWTIGCDNTIAIASGMALANTVTDNLATCVDYCSTYQSCMMVNWTGPHVNGTVGAPNCFAASAIGTAGAAGSAQGSGYATLNS